MPTNEERREVAARLRETSDEIRYWLDTNPYWYVMKRVYGDVEIHDDNELFYRLADLIEPEPERTCEWSQDKFGNWHTSCGRIFVLTNCESLEDNNIVYCHNCGGVIEVVEK